MELGKMKLKRGTNAFPKRSSITITILRQIGMAFQYLCTHSLNGYFPNKIPFFEKFPDLCT